METIKTDEHGAVIGIGGGVVGVHSYETKQRGVRKIVVSATGRVAGIRRNGSKISLFITEI